MLERLEQPLAQKLAERTAGDHLDHPADDVDADAVVPSRARLKGQRKPREVLDRRFQRTSRVEELAPLVHFPDRRIADEMVGQSARVAHQIAQHDRARRIDQSAVRLPHFHAAERRDDISPAGRGACSAPPRAASSAPTQMIGFVIE